MPFTPDKQRDSSKVVALGRAYWPAGRRRPGRSINPWRRSFERDLRTMGIFWNHVQAAAEDSRNKGMENYWCSSKFHNGTIGQYQKQSCGEIIGLKNELTMFLKIKSL